VRSGIFYWNIRQELLHPGRRHHSVKWPFSKRANTAMLHFVTSLCISLVTCASFFSRVNLDRRCHWLESQFNFENASGTAFLVLQRHSSKHLARQMRLTIIVNSRRFYTICRSSSQILAKRVNGRFTHSNMPVVTLWDDSRVTHRYGLYGICLEMKEWKWAVHPGNRDLWTFSICTDLD
jgi:hypothetical protein